MACRTFILNQLAPWNRSLEELLHIQLLRKFPTLYDTQSSPTVLTRPNFWSLS